MAEAWKTLFHIEADRQRFPKAEDYLFHAIDLAEDPKSVLEAGLKFYRRLEKLPDEVLERRNLPRDEVEAALDELEMMT